MPERPSCLNDADLAALAAGQLAPEVAAPLRAHLDACQHCRARLATRSGPVEPTGPTRAGVPPALVPTGTGPDPVETSGPLPRGDSVGRYLILGLLGEGGMGVVYLAYDPELDRKVALKLLRGEPGGSGDADVRARLLREAQAMARLAHPNVVAVFDAGTHGDKVFLAMELVEGKTAKQWLEEKPRSWREVLAVFMEAGRGLRAAHAAGLIHRDFKPDNVFIGNDGRVRVGDFGLARSRSLDQPDAPLPPESTTLVADAGALGTNITRTGTVMGTPAYMAPEQFLGRAADERTDEFSFCVSLYFGLFGRRPFDVPADPLRPPKLQEPPPGSPVPVWIRRILRRGLAMVPGERYPNMDALLAALADDPAITRRRALVASAAVAALATAAWGAVSLRARARAADPCADATGGMAQTWSPATRAAMARAFANSGAPGAAAAAEHAAAGLDGWSHSWTAARQEACGAGADRGGGRDTLLLLKLECLDNQRDEAAALAQMLVRAEPEVVSHAVAAVSALPQPTECASVRTLSAVVRPDAKLRPEILVLRSRLAAAKARVAAARYREAFPELRAVVERSRALGYAPLQAEAQFTLGQALHGDFQEGSALAAFKDAELAAETGRDDILAARAAAEVVHVGALSGADAAASDEWVARAKAHIDASGGDPIAEATLEHSLGVVAETRGELEQFLTHSQRAVELRTRIFGADHVETLNSLNNVAQSLLELGRYQESLQVARQLVEATERTYGSDCSDLASALENFGLLQALLGDYAGSRGSFDRAHQLTARLNDTGLAAFIATDEALLLVAEGKAAEAVKSAGRGIDLLRNSGVAGGPNFTHAMANLAAAELANGEPAETYAACEQILADGPNATPTTRSRCQALEGAAKLALGDAGAAATLLQRALDQLPREPLPPGDLAHIRYDLARALVASHGDRHRAAELASQAHDELAAYPFEKPLLAEVDAWRAKNLPGEKVTSR